MNHKLFSSLTASLLIASLGVPPSSSANPSESIDQGTEPSLNRVTPGVSPEKNNHPSSTSVVGASGDRPRIAQSLGDGDVEKVGEQKSATKIKTSAEVVAKIHAHEVSGRKAATLYVRNLPVLTLVSSTKAATATVKIGTQSKSSAVPGSKSKALNEIDGAPRSLATLLRPSQNLSELYSNSINPDYLDLNAAEDTPVWQATKIAAKINQLHQSGIGADKITIRWDDESERTALRGDRYLIKADTITIAVIDSATQFPNSTRNLEYDALRATNRLRQLVGNAAPLKEVSGKPATPGAEIAFGPIRFKLTGMASWYGPGFDGNQSASGEIFNQHAMTAAHRTLPFGTRVLVTNLDNGQSVVVRINDRGPFHGNRIIDLSTAAARVLGVVSSGVAPVRLDVLDSRSASSAGN